jgi:hypothetical protein
LIERAAACELDETLADSAIGIKGVHGLDRLKPVAGWR